MASCPNKSSQEYKEMVNALGDKLTHYIWDKNNGNPIHLAPNGKPSKLFNDLIKQLGNKEEAIKAKARVYSKDFRNWFGDWLGNDKSNVSKVVDENGEPLMVYHGTDKNIILFEERDGIHFGDLNAAVGLIEEKFIGDASGGRLEQFIKDGTIFLTPSFLNINNIIKSKDIGTGWNSIKHKGYDGASYYAVEGGESHVVFNPNQIKSAILPSQQQKEEFNLNDEKIGKFSEESDNIYYAESESLRSDTTSAVKGLEGKDISVNEFVRKNKLDKAKIELHIPGDKTYSLLFDKAEQYGLKIQGNLVVDTSSELSSNNLAQYNKKDKKIGITANFGRLNQLTKARILGHEILHGIISEEFKTKSKQEQAKIEKNFNDFINSLDEHLDNPEIKRVYDIVKGSNWQEIITYAFSDKKFADALNEIILEKNIEKGSDKTFWDKLKELILSVISDDYTKFDELHKILDNNFKIELYNKNNNTIQTTLSNLNNTPNSKLGRKVLSRLQELKIDDNVPVILVDEGVIGDNKALYAENKVNDDEYIMIDRSKIENKSDFERSLVHEVIHYTAAKSLKKNGELAQEWKTYYEQVRTLFTAEELDSFNIKDEDEFLAEIFTSEELQQKLSTMNPINEKSKYKNLWQEIWVNILEIIGITPKNSLFKESFAFGTHIIENGLIERSKGELKGIHIDGNYRKNNIVLNDYNKVLLEEVDELLKDKSRAIHHFNTTEELNKLRKKVIDINTTQKRTMAFVGKTWGEDNKHSKREYLTIMFYQLTEKQMMLRKAGFISLDGNHKLKYNTSVKTDTAAHRMEDNINRANRLMTKFKYYIKKEGKLYNYDVKLNEKYIDDLVAMLNNYKLNADVSKIPNRLKNNKSWNNMVNRLGLDIAIKIYKFNSEILLNDSEISEFIEKYNGEINPSDNYDDRFKVDEDESNEYDFATDYVEDESELLDETVSSFLDELIYDEGVEKLNIDYSKDDVDLPEELGNMVNDFKTKMKERLILMKNQLIKIKDKKEKSKMEMSIRSLHKLIYTTPYDEINLWVMVNNLTTDLKEMKINIDNNAIDITKLNYYKNVLDLWDTIIRDWKTTKNSKFYEYINGNYQFQKALIKQIAVINELHQQILKLHDTLYLDRVNGIMNNKMKLKDLEEITDVGVVKSMWHDLSRMGNKLTDSIFKVLNNASNVTSLNFKSFNKELLERVNKLSDKYDLTKKDVQMMLLETNDGILTGNMVGRYIPELSIGLDKLDKLRRKINNKKNKNLLWVSSDIRDLENELFDYIDLNELTNKDGMLSKTKLNAYKEKLLKKYDIDKVNNIINDIITKDQLFKDDAVATKEWMYDQIMINTKYETFRAKRSTETDIEYKARIDDLLNQEFQKWYDKNNPYWYINRRNKSNVILNGKAYKYIPYIPKAEYESNKFKDLQKETELYDFYKWYKEQLNKYKEYLPPSIVDNLLYNFLPRLKQDLAQKLRDGNGFIKSMQETILENNTVGFASVVKKLDAMGNEIHEIPVRFLSLSATELKIMLDNIELKLGKATEPDIIESLEKERKNLTDRINNIQNEMSTDLVKIIKSFVIMAENFRAFNNVEDTVKTGQTILKNIVKVISDKETKQSTKKGNVANIIKGAENLIETTDYTINALMYEDRKDHRQLGKKVIFDDKEVRQEYKRLTAQLKVINSDFIKGEIGQYEKWRKEGDIEKKISDLMKKHSPRVLTTNTLARTATNVTGIATLGFNIKSAVNNVLFGKIAIQTHAAGGEDFNLQELKQADKIIKKALRLGGEKQLNTKLKNLSDLYNVVFEVNEAAYGAKSALAEKTEWLDIIKPYGMTRKGEYYLQNLAMIAMLIHTKVDVTEKLTNKKLKITLWDAYNSSGKFKSKYSYLNSNTNKYEDDNVDYTPVKESLKSNKFMVLVDKIQQINKLIHGNYDPRSPIRIKGKDWGTILMQYKTWVPEGWAQRFEKEMGDDMLGRNRKGRYRTMIEVGLWKSLGVYLKAFFNNDKVSSDNYTSIDYANMMKNLVEFRYMIVLLIAQYSMRLLVKGLSGKDDELYIRILRTTLNQLSRLNNDLSFYFNPRNALNTAKEPFPAVQYTIRWLDWLVKSRKMWMPGYRSESYNMGKWMWEGSKGIPGINEVKKWMNEMERINGDW